MDGKETVTARVPHTHSPKSPPLLPTVTDDEKIASGLSTILVASIQEVRDKISQIEYVFCTKLYPHFQTTSKLSDSKRRRIEELEREVDDHMALQKTATEKLETCESENVKLLREIDGLGEDLRTKTKEVEELELIRVENESSNRKLVEQVESLTCELRDEKLKRNRLNEAYKRLKSQHIYLRRKAGLTEENMIRENKSSESDLAMDRSPITEHGIAFEDTDVTMSASIPAKVEMESEIPEEDFEGLEKRAPEVFVATCATNEVKQKALENDKGSTSNPPPPPSSFHGAPKCPPSTKFVSVSGTKRPASIWRQTRSHQSRAGPDLHDDFLDTPLENIRENINKDLNKEDLRNPIQNDISMNSSDDETQDLNAKSSPQKRQSSITVANNRNFKYNEPVRKKAERENLKGVDCKQCRKFYDAVLPNANGKDSDSNKQNLRCEHHDGVSRHRYSFVMSLSRQSRFSNWFLTFRARLHPSVDYFILDKTFCCFWGQSLYPGLVTAVDPHGNTFKLGILTDPSSQGVKLTGTKKMVEFYSIDKERGIFLKYVAVNTFHCRIFELNLNEIAYPFVPSTLHRISGSVFDCRFLQTIVVDFDPSEAMIRLGGLFHYFWYSEVSEGLTYLSDPEGNRHLVDVVDRPLGEFSFVGGVKDLFQFYGISEKCQAWIHYHGNNEFYFRIFTFFGEEHEYPCIVENPVYPVCYTNSIPFDDGGDSWYIQVPRADVDARKKLRIPSRLVHKFGLQSRFHIYLQHIEGRAYKCSLLGGYAEATDRQLGFGWYQFLKDVRDQLPAVLFFSFDDATTINVKIV